MCYTCGCKLPYENHGDPASLVEEHIQRAGAAEVVHRAGVRTAKQNMMELLRMQEEAGDLDNPAADYNGWFVATAPRATR